MNNNASEFDVFQSQDHLYSIYAKLPRHFEFSISKLVVST